MAICNNSIIDVSQERGTIYLGVWDTLNVRQQQFDVSVWIDAYGDEGELLLLVKRNGDELPYSADNITLTGSVLEWTFSEIDTAKVGEGAAALVYIIEGEIIARSTQYPTYVAPTLGMSGSEPPDPWQSWYTQILEASAAAVQAAASASESEANASNSARRAELAETQAVSARNLARDAQTAAETAQGKAEDAQTAAETAQGKAEDAQTAAETAQGKAEDAQTAAETAQGKAEDAQTAAEAAASSISEEAAILAEWQAHRFDPYATETPTPAALIRTDLGADGVPAKTLALNATAGSGTVTVRQMGANLLDARALDYSALGLTFKWSGNGFRVSGTTTSAASSRSSLVGQPANIINYPLLVGVQYIFNCSVSGNTSGKTFSNFDIQVAYTDGQTPSTEAFAAGTPFILTRPGVIRLVRVNSGWTYITIGETYDFNVYAQLEAAAASTDYAPPTNIDKTVSVSGAGEYPLDPLPTTALGINTFWVVPGSGVTATLDATLRLDPTLVYNSMRGA